MELSILSKLPFICQCYKKNIAEMFDAIAEAFRGYLRILHNQPKQSGEVITKLLMIIFL
jgi:hypothetical protein